MVAALAKHDPLSLHFREGFGLEDYLLDNKNRRAEVVL